MPNFRGRRFTNAHETLIWAARRKAGAAIRSTTKRSKPATKTSRSAPTGPFRCAPATKRLKGGDGKKLHPTQKPEALLARVILASSRPDDLVLDPFNGTGTTGAVASGSAAATSASNAIRPTPRARERIAATKPLEAPTLAPFMTAREAPRVAFPRCWSADWCSAGAKLVDSSTASAGN